MSRVGGWLRKAIVAIGGGALAFLAAVLLNRLLIKIGISLQKHPETGGLTLTWVAVGLGVTGFLLGTLVAPVNGVWKKLAELSAAAVGSLIAVYVGVVVGALFGAFKGVHFHRARLAVSPFVIVATVLATMQVLKGFRPALL